MHSEIIYFAAKCIGALMVIAGSAGTGYRMSRNMKLRLMMLKEMKKAILLLRGEIRYSACVLPEAIGHVARRIKSPYDSFFGEAGRQMNQMAGESFSTIWSRGVDQHLGQGVLKKSDLDELKDLGDSLGYLDKDMQLGAIDLFLEHLEIIIESLQSSLPGRQKIYNCLGILGGIFVVILMI